MQVQAGLPQETECASDSQAHYNSYGITTERHNLRYYFFLYNYGVRAARVNDCESGNHYVDDGCAMLPKSIELVDVREPNGAPSHTAWGRAWQTCYHGRITVWLTSAWDCEQRLARC
jgi:hypothetical protein